VFRVVESKTEDSGVVKEEASHFEQNSITRTEVWLRRSVRHVRSSL